MISTRDFSATLLKTSGDVPSPRYGHCAAFTSTTLLILGGMVTSVTGIRRKKKEGYDDSLYLLNLGTSDIFMSRPLQLIITSSVPVSREWTRVVANGPKPCGRYCHTMMLVGSKLFVFGGWDYDARKFFNDIWGFNLSCCTFTHRFPEPFDQICLQ